MVMLNAGDSCKSFIRLILEKCYTMLRKIKEKCDIVCDKTQE